MNKLEELRKRSTNIDDGTYCYYKDIDFYIYPFVDDLTIVFHNKKTYTFKSFDEMINTPFLEDEEKIIDNLDKITW